MRPVVAAPRCVCVVGAGPAALAFVREYRAHNRDDRIRVLSAERELFYNRVLLVEYLAGKRHWAELQLTTAAELAELDLDLHPGAPVTAIDRDRKCVRVASRAGAPLRPAGAGHRQPRPPPARPAGGT